MYQKEICLILLGIVAVCAVIGLIYQRMYFNWLMTGEFKFKNDKK